MLSISDLVLEDLDLSRVLLLKFEDIQRVLDLSVFFICTDVRQWAFISGFDQVKNIALLFNEFLLKGMGLLHTIVISILLMKMLFEDLTIELEAMYDIHKAVFG